MIRTEAKYERMLAEIEALMDKGERRTAEEGALLDRMVSLVEAYEAKHYPLPEAGPA